MRILMLTSLLICALFSFAAPPVLTGAERDQAGTDLTLTPADEDDIREAVFRYEFAHNASGQQQTAKVYFLSLGKDTDPGDAFMSRFKDHKPPVKKRSQATGQFEVIDKETGERGLIFRVTAIKRLDENKVVVDGGYYEAGLSSSGNTYTVERTEHKWGVTKDQMNWIS
jgi:hypothetical protein